MRKVIQIIVISTLLLLSQTSMGQASPKGFDYKDHQRTNVKASRWSKHRMKASGGDQLNLKCSVRKSRRYARRGH